MVDIYLTSYSVGGIKTLEKEVSLSFYKKTIRNDADTRKYNMKAVYGMNGSGKSGIIASADILKHLLLSSDYLNTPFIQNYLNQSINKKREQLSVSVQYLAKKERKIYQYIIVISRDNSGKYTIFYEKLSSRPAASQSSSPAIIYEVKEGEITALCDEIKPEIRETIISKTANLLSDKTFCALFITRLLPLFNDNEENKYNLFSLSLLSLVVFGLSIHVYMDQNDKHEDFLLRSVSQKLLQSYINSQTSLSANEITVSDNLIPAENYEAFARTISQLCNFIRIFKPELSAIEIDRKEDKGIYKCDLIMVYPDCRIHAEFESTGIKKLIHLFPYLRSMVRGDIVFIDEMDSNLHDVYLCALLEYMLNYGKGQLCFTTHNVGPMDILKQHKKSIDFLSMDQTIYPWITNGNYSPARLYRNGMIEGSPFNIDSIDFIGILDVDEEDA